MPDRPIPAMGWPAIRYGFYRAIGRPTWVPKLSQREIAAQRQQDLVDYRFALEEAIKRIVQRRTFTATVTHVKGGVAKTTTSSNMSSMLGETARRTVTQIDSNPMWGTSFRLLGVPREETLTVRQVRDMLNRGELETHKQFIGALGSTRHGVCLVASDAVSQREDHYDFDTAKQVIQCGQRHSVFVVNDTGNDIAGGAMQATLELSDVMVVPSIITGDSIEGARVTFDNYKSWGHTKLVRHSVMVVSGLESGDSAENYRQQLGLGPDHILVGIPYEDRLKNNEVIDLSKNDIVTQIAYLELVFVVTSVARHVQDYGYEGDPLKFEQGQLVPIPSGRRPVLPYVS